MMPFSCMDFFPPNHGKSPGLILWTLILSSLIHNATPTCGQGDATISFLIKDEFGDEATSIRDGGSVDIYCDLQGTSDANFSLNIFSQTQAQSRADEVATTKSTGSEAKFPTFPINKTTKNIEKIFNGSNTMFCICKRGDPLSQNTMKLARIFCDPTEEVTCTSQQVCLLHNDGTRTLASCESQSNIRCQSEGTKDKTNTFRRACIQQSGNTFYSNARECTATLHDLNKWPQVEIDDTQGCPDHLNFWKENGGRRLVLRDVIAFNDTFTLMPAQSSTCQSSGQMDCTIKMKGKTEDTDIVIDGDCNKGWSVNVNRIFESTGTKLVCILTQTYQARWQFYLYPTIVKVTEETNGNYVCKWPGWLEIPDSPIRKESECQHSVKFNFPPSIRDNEYHFQIQGTIPTTTSTTTTPETTTTTLPPSTILTTQEDTTTSPPHPTSSTLNTTLSTPNATTSPINTTTSVTLDEVRKPPPRKSNTSLIIGLTIGATLFLAIVVTVAVWSLRKWKKKDEREKRRASISEIHKKQDSLKAVQEENTRMRLEDEAKRDSEFLRNFRNRKQLEAEVGHLSHTQESSGEAKP